MALHTGVGTVLRLGGGGGRGIHSHSCDYQFVFFVLDELCVSHHAWCRK